jgi:hypothetical protein
MALRWNRKPVLLASIHDRRWRRDGIRVRAARADRLP